MIRRISQPDAATKALRAGSPDNHAKEAEKLIPIVEMKMDVRVPSLVKSLREGMEHIVGKTMRRLVGFGQRRESGRSRRDIFVSTQLSCNFLTKCQQHKYALPFLPPSAKPTPVKPLWTFRTRPCRMKPVSEYMAIRESATKSVLRKLELCELCSAAFYRWEYALIGVMTCLSMTTDWRESSTKGFK